MENLTFSISVSERKRMKKVTRDENYAKRKFLGGHKTFKFPNEKRLSFIISFYEHTEHPRAGLRRLEHRFNFILLEMKLFLIDSRSRNRFMYKIILLCSFGLVRLRVVLGYENKIASS